MANELDLDRIRAVLAAATGPSGGYSQRGLAAAAGEGRDCVGDILNGRNRNPTIKVLTNLARALGGDLSIFGLADAPAPARRAAAAPGPSEDDLIAALLALLPDMPRGSPDKRARFLGEGVARILKLPRSRPATSAEPARSSADAATAPPRAATSRA